MTLNTERMGTPWLSQAQPLHQHLLRYRSLGMGTTAGKPQDHSKHFLYRRTSMASRQGMGYKWAQIAKSTAPLFTDVPMCGRVTTLGEIEEATQQSRRHSPSALGSNLRKLRWYRGDMPIPRTILLWIWVRICSMILIRRGSVAARMARE